MKLNTQIHILTIAAIAAIGFSLLYNPMIILYVLVTFLAIGVSIFFYGLLFEFFHWLLKPRDPNDDGKTDIPGP